MKINTKLRYQLLLDKTTNITLKTIRLYFVYTNTYLITKHIAQHYFSNVEINLDQVKISNDERNTNDVNKEDIHNSDNIENFLALFNKNNGSFNQYILFLAYLENNLTYENNGADNVQNNNCYNEKEKRGILECILFSSNVVTIVAEYDSLTTENMEVIYRVHQLIEEGKGNEIVLKKYYKENDFHFDKDLITKREFLFSNHHSNESICGDDENGGNKEFERFVTFNYHNIAKE